MGASTAECMTAETSQQAEQLIAQMLRHPRMDYQRWAVGEGATQVLTRTLPLLVPFGDAQYHGLCAVLDWDHRLPSQSSYLRIFAYYTEATLTRGRAELEARRALIAEADRYPEFDVPDYAGISADESYEGEVDADGIVSRVRLVSNWRRDVDPKTARLALKVARASQQYKDLLAETTSRPDYPGDLEPVCWTPPCESEHHTWTVDCWYLLYLDASVGKGRSILVDVELETVVGCREFVVRSN